MRELLTNNRKVRFGLQYCGPEPELKIANLLKEFRRHLSRLLLPAEIHLLRGC